MRHLVRLLLLVVLAAAFAGLVSARAHAAVAPPCPDAKPVVFSSPHFDLTYQDDSTKSDAISQMEASVVLGAAEHAYNTFIGMGFPAPAVDALTGKTEIDIEDLTALKLSSIYCYGAFLFDKTTISSSGVAAAVSADVFAEFVYGSTTIFPEFAFIQGLSSWASWLSVGYPAASTSILGPWELSLDCDLSGDPNPITCSTDSTPNLALSRWPFYEYLYEKYGTQFMKDFVAVPDLTGLETLLTAKGTTLAAEYNAFTKKLLVGGWSAAQLNTALPPVSGSPILAGALTGDTPTQHFGVDHLGTRYVQIDRGDGDASHKCYAATLTVKVTLPAGLDSTTSQPVLYWGAANNSPVALTGSGSSLSASVPWDTCTWTTHGYLSLPNASKTLNGANFLVSTHIDVTKTETTATAPAAPANTYGNSTDASAAQGTVPSVTLLGASTIKVKSKATSLSVVVQCSDQGLVSAALGTADLGKVAVVPGTNRLTFKLASGTLRKLRVTSATGDRTLTLTPYSADGAVAGTPLAVKVSVVEPAPKAKVKKTKKLAKRK